MLKVIIKFMFKKVVKILLIVVAIFVLAVLSFLLYMGVLKKMIVRMEHRGPYTMAYVEHIGSYSDVAEPMEKLGKELADAGFDYGISAGIYHNNPKNMHDEQLYSKIGYIVADSDMDKVEANKDKFNFDIIEEGDYVVTDFSLRNTLSYIIGSGKAYPAIGKYLKGKKATSYSASVEIYDTKNKSILFLIKIKD